MVVKKSRENYDFAFCILARIIPILIDFSYPLISFAFLWVENMLTFGRIGDLVTKILSLLIKSGNFLPYFGEINDTIAIENSDRNFTIKPVNTKILTISFPFIYKNTLLF